MTTDPTIGKDGKIYPLTHKQEAFISAYLETGNGSEAYRRAYGARGWSDNAVHVAGSKQLDNPKIAAEIAKRRASVAAKVAVTVESLIAECEEARRIALEDRNATALVSATQLKAKLTGNLTDRVDQTVRQATPEEHKPDLSSLRQKASLVDDRAASHLGTAASPLTESKLTH